MKANNLLEQIHATYFAKIEDKVPAGFKRASEWAKDWNVEENAALKACKRGVTLGMMESIKLRRVSGNRIVPVNFFRPVK